MARSEVTIRDVSEIRINQPEAVIAYLRAVHIATQRAGYDEGDYAYCRYQCKLNNAVQVLNAVLETPPNYIARLQFYNVNLNLKEVELAILYETVYAR